MTQSFFLDSLSLRIESGVSDVMSTGGTNMATTVCVTQSDSIVERLIRPAIQKLLGETDGSYRCERDLHHHFTVCLNGIELLLLGTRRRRVFLEHPGKACYGKGRDGNLDYFFPGQNSAVIALPQQSGAAMELNYNYDSSLKITRDIQKLIDPQNGYGESAYFAFGRKPRFFESVRRGVDFAFRYFAEDQPEFRLPVGLHIFVVESARSAGGGGHLLHEALATKSCTPDELNWLDTTVERHSAPEPEASSKVASIDGQSLGELDALYVDRASGEDLLRLEMAKAGIPLDSITARCMFEATRCGSGQNRCKLGVTPLWNNELRVANGLVLRSEFMDWVQRLCDSGHAFQRAGRAAWN